MVAKTRRWSSFATVSLLAMGTTMLAACGSTTAEGNEVEEISVLHAPINYEPLYIAQKEGFFEEVGLDVEIRPGGTAQDNLSQLSGGSVDISTVSWDAAVTATAEDLPIKLLSGAGVISDEIDTSGVVVRKDSDIDDVADLQGKTIAFNSLNSGGNVPVLQSLKDAGVDLESVEQVALPFASMQTSLTNKQVDAIFPSDSFYAQILKDDSFEVIANPSREYRSDLGITLWAATEAWLAENGDTAEKFNEAMAKAIDFYNDENNVDAVYEVRSEVTGQALEDVKSPLIGQQLEIDPEVSQSTTDALEEFGLVSNPKSVDEILWEGAPRT